MIIIQHPSPNFNARPVGSPVDTLVLHYTGMPTGDAALTRMCEREAQVSAHYMVEEDGRIFQLVAEEFRAWHAGKSYWRGRENLNDCSIGIEIVNPGHEFGYRPFPNTQMQAVIALCQQILSRHTIPAINIVAHSDIAPMRKEDPGELFDWKLLAEHGIGIWIKAPTTPRIIQAADSNVHTQLTALGYNPQDTLEKIIIAFQRRYLPHTLDGPTLDGLWCNHADVILKELLKLPASSH